MDSLVNTGVFQKLKDNTIYKRISPLKSLQAVNGVGGELGSAKKLKLNQVSKDYFLMTKSNFP